jgi:hypothetical protein
MGTLYKNNIPYSNDNGAVQEWAAAQSAGAISSAAIIKAQAGNWSLEVNSSEIRTFAGAPSAMTALYELFIAGGGTSGAFDGLSLTVTPALDMSDVTVTDTTLTIAGFVWEDFSGSPQVIFLDSGNSEISRVDVSGTEEVTIPALVARIIFGSAGASPVFFSPTGVDPYVYVADRRPAFFAAYASQTMVQGPAGTGTTPGENWGVNRQDYRLAPVPGSADSAFTSTATNGPLAWSTNNHLSVDRPVDLGFERLSYSFLSGWTCVDQNQPHYPSNAYAGFDQATAKVMTNEVTDIGSFTSTNPFTDDGLQTGTRGDLKRCWVEVVAAAKQAVLDAGGSNPEVIAYTGYRPLYTDSSMTAIDRTLMGYSKQSDRGGWTGTGDAPAYTPTPGQSTPGRPGYSNSTEAFVDWWGYELDGLREMGFDGVGLDTGAGMWWNAEGMTGAAGTDGNIPGSPRLHNIFKSYGMAVQVEAVNWEDTGVTRRPWGGADGAIYEQGPCWGLAGTTVGWVGRTQDSSEVLSWSGESVSPSDGTLYTNVYNRDGNENATIGDPLSGGTVMPIIGPNGIGTEVHSVWRWDNPSVLRPLFAAFSWMAVKQIIYDYHNAGLVCSSGGSTSATMTDKDGTVVTAKEFNEYILDLSNNVYPTRPGNAPPAPDPVPPGVFLTMERQVGDPVDMTASGQGWLQGNSSYTTITGYNDILPIQNGQYPRLRSSGSGSSLDVWADMRFSSEAQRDAFLANPDIDLDTMCVRVVIRDGSNQVISKGESEPFNVNSTGVANPGSSNLQMKIDFDEWVEGAAPTGGTSATDWVGKPEGWALDSSVYFEVYDNSGPPTVPVGETNTIENVPSNVGGNVYAFPMVSVNADNENHYALSQLGILTMFFSPVQGTTANTLNFSSGGTTERDAFLNGNVSLQITQMGITWTIAPGDCTIQSANQLSFTMPVNIPISTRDDLVPMLMILV